MPEGGGFTPVEEIPVADSEPTITPEADAPSAPGPTAPEATDEAASPPDDTPTFDEVINGAGEVLGEERKEVPQERQQKEINRVGGTVVNQEITKRLKALEAKGPDQMDTTDRAFFTLEAIQNKADGAFMRPLDVRADTEQGQPDIAITHNGRPAILLELTSRNGDMYGGRIRYTDFSQGELSVSDLPAREIAKGVFQAQGDLIINAITDDAAKEATQHYMDNITKGTQVEQGEENDLLVAAAAIDRGIIGPGDFLSYFQAISQETPLSEEQLKAVKALQDRAKTTNILLEDEVEGLFAEMGLPPESSKQTIDVIQMVTLGRAEPEAAKTFLEAMRSGKGDAIAEAVGKILNLSDEEIQNRKRELAGKIATGGLLGLGAIIGILWTVAKAESREFKKALR